MTLIGRQHPEQTLRRGPLALGLGLVRLRIVGERVAGIDLNQIVDHDQFQHAREIEIGGRMLTERQCGERQVPRMLGGIFETGVVGERRAPQHHFQSIGLNEKRDLTGEAIG